jgi:carbon-monoxide dehydrogenase small subunit
LSLTVNRRPVALAVEPTTLLIDLLREQLGLTGSHVGCDTSQCGACTVLVDGQAVKSCNLLALQVRGSAVTTVEGLAAAGGAKGAAAGDGEEARRLHVLQEAFMACHGLQCGYCTPGMLMSAAGLLAETPQPSRAHIRAALEGNLCRCTGYANIVAAVEHAARQLATDTAGASA